MKDRIEYWYNRVDNIRILQKELQLPTVNMTLDEHDLKDLLDILGAFRQVWEQIKEKANDNGGIKKTGRTDGLCIIQEEENEKKR